MSRARHTPEPCGCSDTPVVRRHHYLTAPPLVYVTCDGCGRTGPPEATEKEAIDAWNEVNE